METFRLMSMREFVLEQKSKDEENDIVLRRIIDYAKFLSQPLTIGMLFPCDENGNVLDEPKESDYQSMNHDNVIDYYARMEKFDKAKERVLFEGFEFSLAGYAYDKQHVVMIDEDFCEGRKIEDLLTFDSEINLNTSAQKQIGL